jgi:thiamine-phosphate pyrophosphorylase
VTLGRPLVCLVSDRSRLEAAPETADGIQEPWAGLVELTGLAAEAGVDLVQIREPDLSSRDLLDLVTRILERARPTSCKVVVNDRLDVALAAGAHGVHLKGESIGTASARALAPVGMLVGRSVHSVNEAVAAARDGADYLICGTVFESRSKAPGHRPAGLALVEEVVAAVPIPVVAIGGVTIDRLAEVAATGAAGIAAIGLFHGPGTRAAVEPGPDGTADQVRSRLEHVVAAVRKAFA